MEPEQAILALAALAQPTRLDAFRLLVKNEPEGPAAGDIAKAPSVPQNTMSSHLAILSRAGLVAAKRFGRSIVYGAELEVALLRAPFPLRLPPINCSLCCGFPRL